MFTKEKLYVPGQTVHLIGQIHQFIPGNNIMMVNVFKPDGEPYMLSRPAIGNSFFDFSFLVDSKAPEGKWNIVVRYAAEMAETTFIVTTSGLDRAILGKPTLLNGQGVETAPEERKAGRLMTITADLDSDTEQPQQFAFIVQVYDGSGNPVKTSFVLGSMDPLTRVNPSVNWTPAASGTYTVDVMVWSSLSNPVPLTEKQSRVFEILD